MFRNKIFFLLTLAINPELFSTQIKTDDDYYEIIYDDVENFWKKVSTNLPNAMFWVNF
jgi:hypothetical protein